MYAGLPLHRKNRRWWVLEINIMVGCSPRVWWAENQERHTHATSITLQSVALGQDSTKVGPFLQSISTSHFFTLYIEKKIPRNKLLLYCYIRIFTHWTWLDDSVAWSLQPEYSEFAFSLWKLITYSSGHWAVIGKIFLPEVQTEHVSRINKDPWHFLFVGWFWPCQIAYGILVPWSGIEPMPLYGSAES